METDWEDCNPVGLTNLWDLAKEVGPPPSSQQKSCSQPKSTFDIFNAVSCISQYLQKASDNIQKGIDNNFSEIDDIKDESSNIQGIEPAIKYDPSDDGNNTEDPTASQTSEQSSKKSEESSSQTSSSPTSSCTKLQTASACQAVCQPVANAATSVSQTCSTTCYSTFSGCSATGTITTITAKTSASVCPLSLGGGSSIPPSTDPAGPYTTAW